MSQVPIYVLTFLLGWMVAFLLDGLFWGGKLFRYEKSVDVVSKEMDAIERKHVESKRRVGVIVETIETRLDANQQLRDQSKQLRRKEKKQAAKREAVSSKARQQSKTLMGDRMALNKLMRGVVAAETHTASLKNDLLRHQQQRDSLLADIEQANLESEGLSNRLSETIGFEEKEKARMSVLVRERDEKIAEIKRLQNLKQETEALYHQSLDLTLEKIALNGSSNS